MIRFIDKRLCKLAAMLIVGFSMSGCARMEPPFETEGVPVEEMGGMNLQIAEYRETEGYCAIKVELNNTSGKELQNLMFSLIVFDTSGKRLGDTIVAFPLVDDNTSSITQTVFEGNCAERYLRLKVEQCEIDGQIVPDEDCMNFISVPSTTAMDIVKG